MQDAYVGNLGDFAKHGLLRALTNWPEKESEESEEALPLHSWTDANWYGSERPTVVEFKPPHWKKAQHAFVVFRPEAVQERLDGLTRRFWQQATDPSVS